MNAADRIRCWQNVATDQYVPTNGQPILWTPDLTLALLGRGWDVFGDCQADLSGHFLADDAPDFPLHFLAPDSWDADDSFSCVLRLTVALQVSGKTDTGALAAWAVYAGLYGASGPRTYFSAPVSRQIVLTRDWRAGSLPTGLTEVPLNVDAGAAGSPADTTTATLQSAVLQFVKG